MPKPEKKPCKTCETVCVPYQKNRFPSLVSDHGTIFSSLVLRPNAKYHSSLMTKRHADDLRDLTPQEWEDTLIVLKSDISKIENCLSFKGKPKPLGYRISIPCGEKASQNEPPHFYVRLVPKYKKEWGTRATSIRQKLQDEGPDFSKKDQKQLWEALQPIQNVIDESSKLIVKLQGENSTPTFTGERWIGIINIYTKAKLPNDIQVIDQETWAEIGVMIKKLMNKIEMKTNCHDFIVETKLGKEAVKIFKEEAEVNEFPEQELIVSIIPKFKSVRWWKGERPLNKSNKVIGSMENERYAEELRDPEKYAKIWGKKSPKHEEETTFQTKSLPSETSQRERESIWKQTSTYLLIASGIGICLLGLGIYWLLSKKNKAKSK